MEDNKTENQEEKVNSWKAKIDEIEEKLLKGKAHLEEEFEKQKISFQAFIADTKTKLDNWQDLEEVKKVKAKITEFEGSLSTLKADGLKAFMVQKENIETEIDKLSVNLKELGSKAESEFDEWKAKMKVKAAEFKTKFETTRKNLIGDPDDGEISVLEKTKAEAQEKIQELKEKVSKAMETADDKWDDFTNDVSEGFSKIGNAFKGLFKKNDDEEQK